MAESEREGKKSAVARGRKGLTSGLTAHAGDLADVQVGTPAFRADFDDGADESGCFRKQACVNFWSLDCVGSYSCPTQMG